MDDLISRKTLIEFLDETVEDEEMLVSQYNADWIYSFIESAPSVDAVEVVRCKDCKHYEDHKRKIYENCMRNEKLVPMSPDDFCNYGERKEKGE